MIDLVLANPIPLTIAIVAAGVALKEVIAGRAAKPAPLPVRQYTFDAARGWKRSA